MTTVDARTLRAVSQYMSVIKEAPDLYTVVSESGRTYTVDLVEPACTCADYQYREVKCKHIQRVQLETGATDTQELRTALESRAERLDDEAEELASHAASLRDTAADVRRARHRLDALLEEQE